MKRIASKVLMIFYILAGLVVLGVGYSNVKSVADGHSYPPPGTLINVGRHRLHVDCAGSGHPTVILEAGAGAWSIAMKRIQSALRDSVRVCSYDRAGLGWSDPSSSDFDVGSSIAELRSLVDSAGIAKPFVLVGHSLGANIAQVYGASHRQDLEGIVLVDPGTPDDLLEDFTGSDSAALAMESCGWKCGMASGAAQLGIVRFAARSAGRKRFTEAEGKAYRAGLVRPKSIRAAMGSIMFLPKTAVQTKHATQFGDLPVTVLFSENTREPDKKETPADVAAWHELKLKQMRELLTGTSRPRGPVIVPKATHVTIIFDEGPVRQIADEVLRLIRTRNGASH